MASFFTIDLLRRALLAQQRSMDVTGHNIANVNTPGFTRQEAIHVTAPPSGGPSRFGTTILMGTGVLVPGIRQYRDLFVERHLRQERQTLAEWRIRQELFQDIEAVFPEPSDSGLGQVLGRFWNAWQELSLTPESPAARAALLEQAGTLAASLRQAYRQLGDLRTNLDTAAVGRAERINSLAREIAALNIQITRMEVGGQRANDLRDRREVLLAEITGLADAMAAEAEDGALLVYVQGRQLVGPSGLADEIRIVAAGPGQPHGFVWSDGGALEVRRGALAATLEARDADVPALQARLDAIAASLIAEVNARHQAGYTLTEPPITGLAFFQGTGASDIAVHADLVEDLRLVAASDTGEPGDGMVAVAIAQLRQARVMDGGGATIDDAYRALVAGIGVRGLEAQRQVRNQELLVDQIALRREAASGVSLDEEMTNMLRFQRAYEAAARMLRTVDDMIETILNALGR